MTDRYSEPGRDDADETADAIRVLHVDDDRDLLDLATTFLERADDRLEVHTATSAAEGLDCLDESVDCVVSDYDMPGRNGIDFLESVREVDEDVPFVLYTGKGSEEVASDAISAGVTDYLQKETGTEQYELLANRITNAVEQYRAEQAVERARRRFRTLVEESSDAILVVDSSGQISYAAPSAERILGRSPEELVGTSGFEPIHPDDRERAVELFGELAEHPDERRSVEFRYRRPDGSYIWAEARGRNLLDDPVIDGIVVYTRDTTDRKERELELEETGSLLGSLFDTLPVGVLAEDAARNVMAANERFCDLFGLDRTPTDFVGDDCVELVYGASERFADPEGFRQRIEETIEAGDPVADERLRLADGRTFERSYRPIDLPDGEGHLWTYRDVSDDR